MVGVWWPQMCPRQDRPNTYSVLAVLEPAQDAVVDIVPALKEIEEMLRLSSAQSAKSIDLGKADAVIAMEQVSREEASV